jgi:predicted RNA binding protein YcfA (HicA-like mRNA interferase family)
MFPKTSREIIKRLKKEGWELVSVTGSHHQFKHPKKGRITILSPKKDFKKGTLNSIAKQAGWK